MPLKVAVLGTGNVARKSYLPYLSKMEDVALTYFSRTRSKAEACAQEFGGRVVDSVGELLADDPDTVLVLTHETQRFSAASALLEGRPRRLFFEKPLVAKNGQASVCEDDFFKARDLLRRAQVAGTETAMVFNYRFFDQTVRALEMIKERGFGKLTQATLFVNYACWSHCIDLLHLFGGPASRITALSGEVPYQGAVDVAGSFSLVNGGTGTILGTSGSNFAFPLYDLIFNFEGGQIRFSDLDGSLDLSTPSSRYRESHALIGNHSRWDQYQASFGKSLEAYVDSIRRSAPPPIPGITGLQELQFEAALRRSVSEKRPVDVQEEFSLQL
ncbi:Gfo/Idh/MocA family oxidoreductase [bacterium]|nr:Gfo/Idh/MocA family oxidoreductase [bacterium]